MPEGWRRCSWFGDVKMGLRLKDGDGVLMVTNRRLRVMDVDYVPVVLGKGWFVEEVGGMPVKSIADFRAALVSVNNQKYDVTFSQGVSGGITRTRDFRALCDEAPYESGRRRRPGTEDDRISASMYTDTKTGGTAPEGDKTHEKVYGGVSIM